MKPNIFDYATSELSQDAFLLWLGQWADSKYVDDINLHNSAIEFISALIDKQMPNYSKGITKVNVYKQWANIDVCYTVNDEVLIIIEDKTNTGDHSGQLGRYKRIATDWCSENNYLTPICIFYKSENESRKNIIRIEEIGFSIFNRIELLNILSACNTDNSILTDYRDRIAEIESQTNSFLTSDYTSWSYRSWTGLYSYLQKEFADGHWTYVSNPAGGFVGYWWNFTSIDNYSLYLQIEQGALCFKIGEISKNRSEIRNRISSALLSKAKELGYLEIKKPIRFGCGAYMTVAEVKPIDYISGSIPNLLSNLHKYMLLVKDLVQDN